jgi:hypothetical protein
MPDDPNGDPGKGSLWVAEAFAVVVETISVAVFESPAASVTLAGLTAQAAFVGAPEQVSFTVPLNVALAASVNVATAFWPWLTVVEDGVEERVKAGVNAETFTALAAEVFGLKLPSPL